MRTLTTLLFASALLVAVTTCSFAQTTYNPSCYSNAHGWTVTKVERYDNRTLVYLSVYSHTEEKFFFHPTMYIENYDNLYDRKLNIRSVYNNRLDTWYTIPSKTQYDFVLEFPPIPGHWSNINLKEPASTQGYTSWYWTYISLNEPSTNRLKIDNFFLHYGIGFLAGAAHPFDTYQKCVYTIDYNQIILTIYYNGGYHTKLTIRKKDGFLTFTRSDTTDNNCDLCSPFLSVYLLKQAAMNQDNFNQHQSAFQQHLGKLINDMNGYDVASFILTLMWLGQS
ncbi:hypothetical protein [Runella sp.]|uniref:hypothetical protein n=1 Tax=Runella sp. TaxID=1960881 RepID=UPI003D0A85B0